MQFAVSEAPFIRSVRLEIDSANDRSEFPFTLPILGSLTELELHPRVTFLVGENGSGKSTLIEAIAVSAGLNPEGGSRHFRFSTRKSHSELHHHIRLIRNSRNPRDSYFFRSESFYNVATEIERLDEGGGGPRIRDAYGLRALHEQSHGESLISLITNRFRGEGLYILDEPEAALSPRGVLKLMVAINTLVAKGSQFIIATHSPILMLYPDATLYELRESSLVEISAEDTDHVLLSKEFLNYPSVYLSKLLTESDRK